MLYKLRSYAKKDPPKSQIKYPKRPKYKSIEKALL